MITEEKLEALLSRLRGPDLIDRIRAAAEVFRLEGGVSTAPKMTAAQLREHIAELRRKNSSP